MHFTSIKEFFSTKSVLITGIHSKHLTTGISNNFQLLIDGLKERKIDFLYVNIQTRVNGAVGSFQFTHSLKVFLSILSCWWKILFTRNLYLQVALSRLGFFRDFLIILPASLFGKKIFIRVHGGGYDLFYNQQTEFIKSLIRFMLERTYKIIVLGDSLRDQFNFYSKLREKIVIVPNGLDVPGGKKSISGRNYKQGEIFRILYLSNLIESKGYLDLLKACRLLYQEGIENFHCDFCGDFLSIADEETNQAIDERKTIFQQLISEWHLDNHVSYHGPVIGIKKTRFFENAHAFVLPTNYIWEGQPLSIIEALSFGIPVISTAYRAIPDQVNDGYNGILVNYGNPKQIRDSIAKMMNHEEYYRELSKNALKSYKEKFTLKKHLDLLIPLITQ